MTNICEGIGKTGAKSIAKALRLLGYKVYDWEEQMFNFMDQWIDVFQNGAGPDVTQSLTLQETYNARSSS